MSNVVTYVPYVVDTQSRPRYIYKYFSDITKHALPVIKKSRIHLDNPLDFNDPFETFAVTSLNNCKVCCFSENNDILLMWSHYANKHQGVCIEFDLEKLEDNSFLDSLKAVNINKVIYGDIPKNINNLPVSLFYKTKDWEYEKEYRIVCYSEDEFLCFDCVSRLILGAKVNMYQKNIKMIILEAKKRNIPIYKFVINDDRKLQMIVYDEV